MSELSLAGAILPELIWARRAWNASQLLQDEISRYVFWLGSHTDIKGLRRRESHVAGAQKNAPIRQAEPLENGLRLA